MACESAFPYVQYAYEVVFVLIPAVKKHVSESRSCNGCNNRIDEHGVEHLFWDTFIFEVAQHNAKAENESQGEKQAVPTKAEISEEVEAFVHSPCNC